MKMELEKIEEKNCVTGEEYLVLQPTMRFRIFQFYKGKWYGEGAFYPPVEIYKLPNRKVEKTGERDERGQTRKEGLWLGHKSLGLGR